MEIDPHMLTLFVGTLQVILLGLATWTLTTTIKTKERVIRLESKVFDSMVVTIKDHSERIKQLEHELLLYQHEMNRFQQPHPPIT